MLRNAYIACLVCLTIISTEAVFIISVLFLLLCVQSEDVRTFGRTFIFERRITFSAAEYANRCLEKSFPIVKFKRRKYR
jgi:competence protein ComGF